MLFQSQKWIDSMKQLMRRPCLNTKGQSQCLMEEEVLTQAPDSHWLLDFWARKRVAGLLLMPITRHQLVHLNACFMLKRNWVEKSHDLEANAGYIFGIMII